MFVH
jgi:hypothetical protein